MTTINLGRAWNLGAQLARGGFARVFEATADDGTPAVVKLVPKAPGASRELLFEQLSGLPNVIPILDTGEWEDSYVLVMPRAEKSLRQHLQEAGGRLAIDEVLFVLADVAEALASLQPGVVHRDLKPENILLYQGHWCIADFGIARYAGATTAPDTHKYAMTPPYAAPEQWRGERATAATDVYAFGVMAFEQLEGARPFPGPDFRDQHLNAAPPPLPNCPPSLAALVKECLFKAPEARPTPANLLARLKAVEAPSSSAAARLQLANRAIVERQSEADARLSAHRSAEERRRRLFHAAKESFDWIRETIRMRVLDAAPATTIREERGGLTLLLGEGALVIDAVQAAPADCLAAFDYYPPFDVIAYTAIAARKTRDGYGYEGRAHSLWFCDAQDDDVYRWYELAFMVLASVPERFTLDPFALPPTDEYAGRALAPVMDVRQLAWQPRPFDQGEEEQFIERWLEWFAAAAEDSLVHPRVMPDGSGGGYRRPRRRDQ